MCDNKPKWLSLLYYNKIVNQWFKKKKKNTGANENSKLPKNYNYNDCFNENFNFSKFSEFLIFLNYDQSWSWIINVYLLYIHGQKFRSFKVTEWTWAIPPL